MKNQKIIVTAAILILVVAGFYFLFRNRKREGAITMSGDYVTQDVYNQLKERLQGFQSQVYDMSSNVAQIKSFVNGNSS